MRITRDQSICGYPALAIRDLVQRAAQHPWGFGLDLVEGIIGIDEHKAHALIQALQVEGYIEPFANFVDRPTKADLWQTTVKGNALGNASAAPPLSRPTADRAVAELLVRARQVNASPEYAFFVERLTLFGSYLGDGETVNDVDVAVQLSPRLPDREAQHLLEEARIKTAAAAGRSFSNIIAQLGWPQQEVYLFLKKRSRVLSLHEERQHLSLLASIPTRVIFERVSVATDADPAAPGTSA